MQHPCSSWKTSPRHSTATQSRGVTSSTRMSPTMSTKSGRGPPHRPALAASSRSSFVSNLGLGAWPTPRRWAVGLHPMMRRTTGHLHPYLAPYQPQDRSPDSLGLRPNNHWGNNPKVHPPRGHMSSGRTYRAQLPPLYMIKLWRHPNMWWRASLQIPRPLHNPYPLLSVTPSRSPMK